MNFVSLSDNFDEAKKSVYDRINKLNWTGGFYRTDIGYKVVDKWELFLEILREKKY